MTVAKNGGYVEDLADDATIGQVEEVKRKASATQVNISETAAYEEKEVSKQEGAKAEARHKEAGEEQTAKFVEGNAEGQLATELVTPAAIGVGINLAEGLRESRSNPSQGADVAKAKSEGVVVSKGAESLEDGFKRMKQAPISTPFGRSMSEKSGALSSSMKSLAKHTKGVRDSGSRSTQIVGEVKTALSVHKSLANEGKLARANQLEQTAAPSPGGMGSQAPNSVNQLGLNNMAPKAPSNLPEEGEEWG